MARHINHKLGRAIDVPEEDGQSYVTYEVDWRTKAVGVTREDAFDWLHGKDPETTRVQREEKLRIVRQKLLRDVETMMDTCESNDSWLDQLWQDVGYTLTVLPR